MRTIVFILDDSQLHSVDFSDPRIGNPGVGGTEYLFVALAYELAIQQKARIVLVHLNDANKYPAAISTVRVSDLRGSLRAAFRNIAQTDAVIVRGHDSIEASGLLNAVPAGVPVIAWAHNYLRYSTSLFLARAAQIRKIVYVGREQYAVSSSLPSHFKSTYIYNGYYMPHFEDEVVRAPGAVYIGSLVPSKGFHRLARLWPQILERSPSARLHVIGSGRVHSTFGELGALGLAAPTYESSFLRYLGRDPAKFNVVFHGKLGVKKFHVMRQATVGLPNPTGYTECCPGSVLELSSCGTAVVGPNRWGMCDTVIDGVTGRLCRKESEYVAATASLLNEPQTALRMGEAGRDFVCETFDFGVVVAHWVDLIEQLRSSKADSEPSAPAFQGDYPFRILRRTTVQLRSNSLAAGLSVLDRAHGWLIKKR